MRGWDANGPKSGNTEPMTLCDNHTNATMAGNVLGEGGVHRVVQRTFTSVDNFPNDTIYNLHATPAASISKISNYTTVNNGIATDEVGDSIVASYLYSSKPSWFGSLPWPWCDPFNFSQSNNFQNLPAGYRAARGVDPAPGSAPPPAPPASLSAPSNLRIVP